MAMPTGRTLKFFAFLALCVVLVALLSIQEESKLEDVSETLSSTHRKVDIEQLLQTVNRPKSASGRGSYWEVLGRSSTNSKDEVSTLGEVVTLAVFNTSERQFSYSVTMEEHLKHTSTATLIKVFPSQDGDTGPTMVYQWKPRFPGVYTILVHEIPVGFLDRRVAPSKRILGSTSRLAIIRSSKKQSLGFSRNRPLCQFLNSSDAFTTWDGDWIGPAVNRKDHQLPDVLDTIRTGWSFIPQQCDLQTFSKDELNSLTEPKSVYIMGTSRERGVFLSLVDILLSPQEKEKIDVSEISKCWGRAQIEKRNMRVLYQDMRAALFEHPNYLNASTAPITCHGEKVAVEKNFFKNATLMLKEMFHEESEWPDVILLLNGCDHGVIQESSPCVEHTHLLLSMLPTEWKGTVFINDLEFNGRRSGLYSQEKHREYSRTLSELAMQLSKRSHQRVYWLDGMGIAKENRLYSEFTGKIGASYHFHRWCNQGDIRVCSNTTEMVAQLLLGFALGDKTKLARDKGGTHGSVRGPANHSLSCCTDCPLDMLPMHIQPHPSLTCQAGPLTPWNNRNHIPWAPRRCPQACMAQNPTETMETQSDIVEVRVCNDSSSR